MRNDLQKLRKKLPPGPALKPLTPSLDRLWELIEQKTSPRQKWVNWGLESEDGTPLSWHDHRKTKG